MSPAPADPRGPATSGPTELPVPPQGDGQRLDHKSLRKVTGKTGDLTALAEYCVASANGAGGQILIGIEDGAVEPQPRQQVSPELLDHPRKRIGELTVNMQALPSPTPPPPPRSRVRECQVANS